VGLHHIKKLLRSKENNNQTEERTYMIEKE
jgi:hypothetical protein